METWVDFKAVKAAVSIQAVLEQYQVSGLKRSGDELRAPKMLLDRKPTKKKP